MSDDTRVIQEIIDDVLIFHPLLAAFCGLIAFGASLVIRWACRLSVRIRKVASDTAIVRFALIACNLAILSVAIIGGPVFVFVKWPAGAWCPWLETASRGRQPKLAGADSAPDQRQTAGWRCGGGID